MTDFAPKHYQALLQRLSEWSAAEELGKARLPTTQSEMDRVQKRLLETVRRAEMFRIKPDEHPKQALFLKAKGSIQILASGNKFGKTYAMLLRIICALLGCAPWDPDGQDYVPTKIEPPVEVALAGPSFTTWLPMNVLPRLRKLIPWDAIVTQKNQLAGGVIDFIRFWNGSSLKILSYDQAIEKFESWSVHLMAWDEPMPETYFTAASRGCVEFSAPQMMAFTPLYEPWIWDQLYNKAVILTQGGKVKSEDDIVCVTGSIYDNPYIAEKEKKKFEARCPAHEREARIHGKWIHLRGLVYDIFDPEINVRTLEDLVWGGSIPASRVKS